MDVVEQITCSDEKITISKDSVSRWFTFALPLINILDAWLWLQHRSSAARRTTGRLRVHIVSGTCCSSSSFLFDLSFVKRIVLNQIPLRGTIRML